MKQQLPSLKDPRMPNHNPENAEDLAAPTDAHLGLVRLVSTTVVILLPISVTQP